MDINGFEWILMDVYIYIIDNVVKQCHKPCMTGNGNHGTYIFMVMWGMVTVLPTLANIMAMNMVHIGDTVPQKRTVHLE
jgi:hypothetical protein